ncbi:MAG: thioredoxin [Hyphomicrobiaceae bacterium]
MDLGSTKSPGTAANIVKDATSASFAKDVIEASKAALVLVDFWAPWCGPCKQLTPVLEKVVRSYNGKVLLVKINTDEHPAIAGQLRIQSLPTVYAFKDGRPLDGFMGAQPESAIRQIIDRLIGPSDEDADLEAVLASGDEALAANDLPGAAEVFAAVLDADQGNVRALLGLTKVYIQSGDLTRAEATLDVIPPDKRKQAAYDSVKALLDLAKKAGTTDNSAELEARLADNPADHQARSDLAVALAARGDKEQAVEHLIEIVRRDRNWNEQAARQQLVQLFEAWGPKDPCTIEGRRKLASLLFR